MSLIIQQELNYDVHEQLLIVDRGVPTLNKEQNTIFITTSKMWIVNNNKQHTKVSFIDGRGHKQNIALQYTYG